MHRVGPLGAKERGDRARGVPAGATKTSRHTGISQSNHFRPAIGCRCISIQPHCIIQVVPYTSSQNSPHSKVSTLTEDLNSCNRDYESCAYALPFSLTLRLLVYEIVCGTPNHPEYLADLKRSKPLQTATPKRVIPRSIKPAHSMGGGPPVPGTWATGTRAAGSP